MLLAHPGGPYWAKKDQGVWTIPKGEFEPDEEPLTAARREFEEETGISIGGPCIPLGTIKQRSGKTVHVWAVEGDADPKAIKSNTFTLEWPPKSGRMQDFPEVDEAVWYGVDDARTKIKSEQFALIELLQETLRAAGA